MQGKSVPSRTVSFGGNYQGELQCNLKGVSCVETCAGAGKENFIYFPIKSAI